MFWYYKDRDTVFQNLIKRLKNNENKTRKDVKKNSIYVFAIGAKAYFATNFTLEILSECSLQSGNIALYEKNFVYEKNSIFEWLSEQDKCRK